MKKYLYLFAVLLFLMSAFCTYAAKGYVKNMYSELAKIELEIDRNMIEISILQTELSYLLDPVRLSKFADEHLKLRIISNKDILEDFADLD